MAFIEVTWDFTTIVQILLIVACVAALIVVKHIIGPLRNAAIIDRWHDWRRGRILKKSEVEQPPRTAQEAAEDMIRIQEATGTIPPAVVKPRDSRDIEESPGVRQLLEEQVRLRRDRKTVIPSGLVKVEPVAGMAVTITIPYQGMVDPDAAAAILALQEVKGSAVRFHK
ncbi:MAG: hypothetical protein WC683_15670 [bacterium]